MASVRVDSNARSAFPDLNRFPLVDGGNTARRTQFVPHPQPTSLAQRHVTSGEETSLFSELRKQGKKRLRFEMELYLFNKIFSHTYLGGYSFSTGLGIVSSVIGGNLAVINAAHFVLEHLFSEALLPKSIMTLILFYNTWQTYAVITMIAVMTLNNLSKFKLRDCLEKKDDFWEKLPASLWLNFAWACIDYFKRNAEEGSFFLRWGMKDVLHYAFMNLILYRMKKDPEEKTIRQSLLEVLIGSMRGYLRFLMIERFPLSPGPWRDLIKISLTMVSGCFQDAMRYALIIKKATA